MRYLLPVLIAVVFLIEGTWFQVLVPPTDEFVWVPRFAFVMIVIISMYKGALTGLIYGGITGLFQDVVYSSLIGVYMFSYGFLAYMGGVSYESVRNRPMLVLLVIVLAVSALELLTYGIYQGIGYTSAAFGDFAWQRWLPSVLLNGAFGILIMFPMRKIFNRLEREDRFKKASL
ncbi:rod shape-determining protein MreD [Salicibibacter cibarius]|uniref:Rod shape-determining protein MreD n=1 Tax=Salicibibacter cibarius TaxID=2743000 RepID=A0A7T6Z507_9BACI|nr:rod shape-determining protein MreD [Salicibibacter cibarius]QQK77115.1 rod shape-determining protein MreD [Salicibibacter cibarius]